MGAIRDDETAARSIGKRPVVVKLVIFALSSAIAGIAGGLYSGLLRFVSPESFTLDTSMEVLAIIVVGGLGSFFGPWIGALIVILVPQALTFLAIPPSWSGPINEVIYSLLIILVIIFRPQGILGGMSSATPWKPLRRRVWTPQLHHQSRAVKDLSTSFGNETREPSDRRLVVKDLSVSFGGNKAVDSVSFELKPGEITALVGPNGAGKTTVFNLITGYVKPDSGTVLLGDQDLTDATPEHRAKLGLVRSFQSIKLFEQLTVLDNVRVAVAEPPAERLIAQFGPQKTIREEIDAAALHVIEQFGLADKTSVRAGVLSFADQKMLMLARLFATGAEFVLLDEPMSGLDAAARERVCAALKTMADRGTAICLVEHSLEVVKSVCTWVEFLAEGRLIAEGPTEEVVSRRELQELYFGV